MDSIYQATHMTSVMNKKDIDVIKSKMDKAISGISNTNQDNVGSSNLSSLIAKNNIKDQLFGKINGKNVIKGLEDIMNNPETMSNITYLLEQNKNIIEFDRRSIRILDINKLEEKLFD